MAAGADGRRPLACRILTLRVAVEAVGEAAQTSGAKFARPRFGLEAARVRADHGENLLSNVRPFCGGRAWHPFGLA